MTDSKSLIRLVYASKSAKPVSLNAVISIVAKARSLNKTKGITGALLYDAGIFIQILEGPKVEVDQLYANIEQDKRHRDACILLYEPIRSRLFADWSMGHSGATQADLDKLPGLNGFFSSGKTAYDMGHPQLEALLAAFREGTLLAA